MLYVPPDQAKPTRIQGAFVSDKEVRRLVEFLKTKNPPVEYTEEVISKPLILKKTGSMGDGRDALFEEAIRSVNINKMLEYLKKIKKSSLLKRVGYLLEKQGFKVFDEIKYHLNNKYIFLDPIAKK